MGAKGEDSGVNRRQIQRPFHPDVITDSHNVLSQSPKSAFQLFPEPPIGTPPIIGHETQSHLSPHCISMQILDLHPQSAPMVSFSTAIVGDSGTRGCKNSLRRQLSRVTPNLDPQSQPSNFNTTMAPSTRAVHRETTPSTHIEARERDAVQKTRFYKEHDLRCSSESLRAIAKSLEVPESSARLLLRQRALLGNKAYRKLRPQSQNLGRKQTVPPETLQMLISEENPVRNQPYDRQIEFHQISIKPRSLQLRLTEHTNKAQRYKQAYIAKEISVANLQHRVNYGEKYQYETIDSFWQFVLFTDEAHFDPSSQGISRILREQGTRYNPENIQQRPELEGVKLHVAGWVNWHAKCERLEFYNDEEEYEFRSSTRGRPRRSKYEPEEAYSQRVLEWEAERPHTRVVKPKGNAMT